MADQEKSEQPWGPLDLDAFAARLRDVSGVRPPALGELRRAGKFDPPVVPPPVVPVADPRPEASAVPEPTAPADLPGSTRIAALGPRPGLGPTSVGGRHPALSAFLSEESASRLAVPLDVLGIELVTAPDLPTALSSIAQVHPPLVFTGLELGRLHAPSLIAALRACPYHRCLPIAVVTNRNPRLLDLSLYRPDAVIAEDAGFEGAVEAFVGEFRVQSTGGRNLTPGWWQLEASVLLVENSTMTRRYVGKVLHVAGAEVVAVEDTAEAMIVAAELEFDLILLDLELPGSESKELARYFRNALSTARTVGLTTGNPDPMEWGLDTILHKPIRRSHLVSVCNRLVRSASGASPGLPRRTG